jgi:hypothetical protein
MQHSVIDKINTGLILIALVLAYCIPFKLFLLSYAILGPLHYLTEIHWLKTKQYFISKKSFLVPILLVFTLCISLFSFARLLKPALPDTIYQYVYSTITWANTLLFVSFSTVVLVKLLKDKVPLYINIAVSLMVGVCLKFILPSALVFFGLFVPTLLHVYVFTFLFMIYGFKRNKNVYGKANLYLVILVPIVISALPLPWGVVVPNANDITVLDASQFTQLHFALAKLSSLPVSSEFVYNSVWGRKIQIFIAFAYLYHYLNWFSKTSVIGWKKNLNTTSMLLIVTIWMLSLLVYWYDFTKGFMALFFLSFLHVLLEFPLNIETVKALFRRS